MLRLPRRRRARHRRADGRGQRWLGAAPAAWRWSPARPRATCSAGLLLGGAARALARRCSAPASAGRGWRRRASRPGGRTTSWRCAAMSRCCATTARLLGIRSQLGRAAAARAARRLHRRRRARLQPRPRDAAASAAASRRCTSSARRSGPGAASASTQIAPRGRPRAVPVPVRAGDLLQAHGIAATYVGHPLADAIPLERAARCRARRAGLWTTARRWSRCCRAAGARRSSTSRRAVRQPRRAAAASAAGAALRAAGGRRAARADRAAAGAHARRRLPIAAARRPLARGAGGLRRGAGRQRHRDARGGAVQAADGDRLRDERAELADHEAHAATSPGSGCRTSCAGTSSCPSCCRTTPTPRRLAAAALSLARRRRPRAQRWRERFTELHHAAAARHRALLPPMPSRKSSSAPEQLGLCWDRRRADGRRRRGRPRPAGRAGGRRRGDPRRAAADPRAGRLEAADAAATRALDDEIRARALCCCVAEASVEEIDTLNILQATHAGDAARGRGLRLRAAARAGRRQPAAGAARCRCEAIVKGDAKVAAISAASILAKVHRDRLCHELHQHYPQYGFAEHKGYSTPEHLSALRVHGAVRGAPAQLRAGARGVERATIVDAVAMQQLPATRRSRTGVTSSGRSQSRDNPLLVRLRRLAARPARLPQAAARSGSRASTCARALRAQRRRAAQAVVSRDGLGAAGAARPGRPRGAGRAWCRDALFAGVSALESPAGIGFRRSTLAGRRPHRRRRAHASCSTGIQDAGNVGSILRSAAAFGFTQVIALQGTAALWSPKVLRAGMGAHFALRLVEASSADDLGALAACRCWRPARTRGHALRPVELPWPCAWVLGHEGQGVVAGAAGALRAAAAHLRSRAARSR